MQRHHYVNHVGLDTMYVPCTMYQAPSGLTQLPQSMCTQLARGIASDVTTRKSAVASSEPTEIVLGQNQLNCLASTDRLHKCSDFRKISCYTCVYSLALPPKNRALLGNAHVNYFRAIHLYQK